MRDSRAQVSVLEVAYFGRTTALAEVNPLTLGYNAPIAKSYVTGTVRAALVTQGE